MKLPRCWSLFLASLFLLYIARVSGGDPCTNYLSGCDNCVSHEGCGWCSWGQGSCVTGTDAGPQSSVCHEDSGGRSNWYYATCSDACFLVCGITCSASQDCNINREVDPPECTCETKEGIIIAAVVGSIFLFCLLLTIFVCIRRRNALKYSRQHSAAFDYNNGPSSYAVLPGGQPPHLVGFSATFPPQTEYENPAANGTRAAGSLQ